MLGTSWRIIKQSIVDLEQMFRLKQEPLEIKDVDGAPDLKVTKGEIKFDHVTFQYTPDGRKILDDVSIEVPSGSMVFTARIVLRIMDAIDCCCWTERCRQDKCC